MKAGKPAGWDPQIGNRDRTHRDPAFEKANRRNRKTQGCSGPCDRCVSLAAAYHSSYVCEGQHLPLKRPSRSTLESAPVGWL
jgi:hypothetical protein